MCRGNQQRDIFLSDADADLFLRCMEEMCARSETHLHAWCLMSNHYHLLLETPHGNLVEAMKWLQGTFTQRYNARHQLWGHLFQGRYKAKVVDDADSSYFQKVSEYIHLNPADAGLVAPGKLAHYSWSSYPLYLSAPSKRPGWLKVEQVLNACGLPEDSLKCRRAYRVYMDQMHRVVHMKKMDPADKTEWDRMERGWVHGDKDFRLRMIDLLETQGRAHLKSLVDVDQKRDLGETAARAVLLDCLAYFGLSESDLAGMPKSAPEKMLTAGLLRYHFPVKAEWVAENLSMGHFTTVSRAMRFYDDARGKWMRKKQEILKFIG